MDEIGSSSPPQLPTPPTSSTTTTSRSAPSIASGRDHRGTPVAAISCAKEGIRYVKALLLGEPKKTRARNERDATEADLQPTKMQVGAADPAEDSKKRIHDKSA